MASKNPTGPEPIERLVERVKKSIVCLKSDKGLGSGFFIDKDGVIVTNRHVVEGADAIEVIRHDEKRYPGKLLYLDPKIDISFVASEAKNINPLVTAKTVPVKQGTSVIAIGHPLGLNFSVTKGIISALDRDIEGCCYLQTDVSINPGNSGGPLVSNEGHVVGMCTLSLKGYPGLNFAIPVSEIYKRYEIVRALIKGGKKSSVRCMHCNSANPISERYCKNCGATLSCLSNPKKIAARQSPSAKKTHINVLTKCPFCGLDNMDKDAYCPNCGVRLIKEGRKNG